MAANVIRLNPLDPNQILVDEDTEGNLNLIVLTNESGQLPSDFRFNSGSTVLGRSDNNKKLSGEGGPNPSSTRPKPDSGNS